MSGERRLRGTASLRCCASWRAKLALLTCREAPSRMFGVLLKHLLGRQAQACFGGRGYRLLLPWLGWLRCLHRGAPVAALHTDWGRQCRTADCTPGSISWCGLPK